MNETEKMIWAAAYARIYADARQRISDRALCARLAAEAAYEAVDDFRTMQDLALPAVARDMVRELRGR